MEIHSMRTAVPTSPTSLLSGRVQRFRESRRETDRERLKKSYSNMRQNGQWSRALSQSFHPSQPRTSRKNSSSKINSKFMEDQLNSHRGKVSSGRWQTKRRPRLGGQAKTTRRMNSIASNPIEKDELVLPISRIKSAKIPIGAKSARIASTSECLNGAHSSSNMWGSRATMKVMPVNIEFTPDGDHAESDGTGKVTLAKGKYEKMVQTISNLQQQIRDLEMENKKLRIQMNQRSRRRSPVQGHGIGLTNRSRAKKAPSRRPATKERITRDTSRVQPEVETALLAAESETIVISNNLLIEHGKSPDTARSDSEEWEESSLDGEPSSNVVESKDAFVSPGFKLDLSRINRKDIKALADLSDQNSDPSASFEITDSGTYRQGVFRLNKHGIRVETKQDSRSGGSSTKRTSIKSDDLVLLRVLGRGSCAVVYKCYNKASTQFVALKLINIFEQEKRRQLAKELKTLTSVTKNEFLIDFYGAYFEEGSISLVLEYMDNGSLQDLIERTGRGLPEHLNANISRQVLEGLKFLHQNHKIHRDLKPANILLDTSGNCKITDFGILANVKDTQNSHDLSECKTFIGTLYYMSPERIEGKAYSYGSDLWSFGLTILACAIGKHPITSKDHLDLMSKFKTLPKLIGREVSLTNISLKFSDFLNWCIDMNPDKRPSCNQLLKHGFLIGATLQTAADTLARSPHWVFEKPDDRSQEEDLLRICDEYAKKMKNMPSSATQELARLYSTQEKKITILFQKSKARLMLAQ